MTCSAFMFQLAIVFALTLSDRPAQLNIVHVSPPMTLAECERVAWRARRYETNNIAAICI